MGINLEYLTLLSSLKKRGELPITGSVVELGAQEISADPTQAVDHLKRCGIDVSDLVVPMAKELYGIFGFTDYYAIDATGERGAEVLDLNKNLKKFYGFERKFDLVTDLGTFEHVFNISSAFENSHNLCKKGGLMIHALPSNGNANHGYYVIQPRIFGDIAAANDYEILDLLFSVDYRPNLYRFSMENYKKYDDRDLMVYAVLRKCSDSPFQMPFDSLFSLQNKIKDYQSKKINYFFPSYIKGTWESIRPKSLKEIPIIFLEKSPDSRTFIKKIIDKLGKYFG